MTDRDDELQRQLRALLDEAARGTSHVDLATASLERARRMRTRRRIAVVAVTAAAVAVIVPVGLRVGMGTAEDAHVASTETDSASASGATTADRTPSPTASTEPVVPVEVDINRLTEGPAPAVAYVDRSTFHGHDGDVTLDATPDPLKDVAQFDTGIGVWTENPQTSVKRFSTNGTPTTLPTDATVSNPAIDSKTGAVTWAAHGVDASGNPSSTDTLFYTTHLSGAAQTLDTGPYVISHVMGASGGTVVFNATDGHQEAVIEADVSTGQLTDPWANLRIATAVSPNLSQIAGQLTSQRPSCSAMLNFSDATAEWRSCSWRPVEFSPDGSRVIAFAPYDGLGPRDMAVLDAATGAPIRTFTTHETIARATFESPDTVVFVLAGPDQSAIVRCDVSGSCESAAPPLHSASPPDNLQSPYQITAN